MSPGSSTESYPAFARIELRENPGKTLNQVTCPDRESNLGHLVSRPDALTVTPQNLDCLAVDTELKQPLLQAMSILHYNPAKVKTAIMLHSRRLRWAWHVAYMSESRNAYRVLIWRPEGKRPLGRPRHRWEDNIKMDLREVGYGWINLAQDRDRWQAYARAAMNLRVP
ncbi:hypothetical protein ANN_01435 [Periplaneta americana]|uniref:Uncharacterized protein n=1 Tax=Periplaneta americana TaxID=6978 RepID=A0ABQ8TTK8_PERAM|nr:hypothetical protein ANN_01435 [Periplaneta americana]